MRSFIQMTQPITLPIGVPLLAAAAGAGGSHSLDAGLLVQ